MNDYQDQHEAFGPIAEGIFFTFLCAGLGLSLGVAGVMACTIAPGEKLHELVFWPLVGAFGFGIALAYAWMTEPWDYTNTGGK